MHRALKLNCHMLALLYLPVGRVKHDYMPALRGPHCIFQNIDLENAEEFSDDFWEEDICLPEFRKFSCSKFGLRRIEILFPFFLFTFGWVCERAPSHDFRERYRG